MSNINKWLLKKNSKYMLIISIFACLFLLITYSPNTDAKYGMGRAGGALEILGIADTIAGFFGYSTSNMIGKKLSEGKPISQFQMCYGSAIEDDQIACEQTADRRFFFLKCGKENKRYVDPTIALGIYGNPFDPFLPSPYPLQLVGAPPDISTTHIRSESPIPIEYYKENAFISQKPFIPGLVGECIKKSDLKLEENNNIPRADARCEITKGHFQLLNDTFTINKGEPIVFAKQVQDEKAGEILFDLRAYNNKNLDLKTYDSYYIFPRKGENTENFCNDTQIRDVFYKNIYMWQVYPSVIYSDGTVSPAVTHIGANCWGAHKINIDPSKVKTKFVRLGEYLGESLSYCAIDQDVEVTCDRCLPGCLSDFNCKGNTDTGKTKCDKATQQCIKLECKDNGDCVSNRYGFSLCDKSTNRCTKRCDIHSNCPIIDKNFGLKGEKPFLIETFCLNNKCKECRFEEGCECTKNSECDDGKSCIVIDSKNTCNYCTDDTQCKNNPNGEFCVPKYKNSLDRNQNICGPPECSTTNDCLYGRVCKDNHCTACESTADCSGKYKGLLCKDVRGDNLCESCTDIQECPDGKVCKWQVVTKGIAIDISQKMCVDCTDSSECTDSSKPICIKGSCTSCADTKQCRSNPTLINTACDTDTGTCSPCLPGVNSTVKCLPGEYCNITGKTWFCDSKACNSDFDCPGTNMCVNNQCTDPISCSTMSDCPSGLICKNGVCNNCTDTEEDKVQCYMYNLGTCIDGNCKKCQNDDQCPIDTLCNDQGKCRAKPCKSDSECSDGKYCSINEGKCYDVMPCKTSGDCSPGLLCINNACRNCSDQTNKQCIQDYGNACISGYCNKCDPVRTDQCYEGYKCTTTGMCKQSCNGNSDCDSDLCVSGFCQSCKTNKDCVVKGMSFLNGSLYKSCKDGVCIKPTSYEDCDKGNAFWDRGLCSDFCQSTLICKDNPIDKSCINNKCQTCTKDTDCVNDELGTKCINGTCGCLDINNCSAKHRVYVHWEADICLDNKCSICKSHAQCPVGQICGLGLWDSCGQCKSDDDCIKAQHPDGDICLSGKCYQCKYDSDCTNGKLCSTTGQCVEPGPKHVDFCKQMNAKTIMTGVNSSRCYCDTGEYSYNSNEQGMVGISNHLGDNIQVLPAALNIREYASSTYKCKSLSDMLTCDYCDSCNKPDNKCPEGYECKFNRCILSSFNLEPNENYTTCYDDNHCSGNTVKKLCNRWGVCSDCNELSVNSLVKSKPFICLINGRLNLLEEPPSSSSSGLQKCQLIAPSEGLYLDYHRDGGGMFYIYEDLTEKAKKGLDIFTYNDDKYYNDDEIVFDQKVDSKFISECFNKLNGKLFRVKFRDVYYYPPFVFCLNEKGDMTQHQYSNGDWYKKYIILAHKAKEPECNLGCDEEQKKQCTDKQTCLIDVAKVVCKNECEDNSDCSGKLVCDDNKECNKCTKDSQCPDDLECTRGVCLPKKCGDGIRDLDLGEDCDFGIDNTDDLLNHHGCTLDCKEHHKWSCSKTPKEHNDYFDEITELYNNIVTMSEDFSKNNCNNSRTSSSSVWCSSYKSSLDRFEVLNYTVKVNCSGKSTMFNRVVSADKPSLSYSVNCN